jgi:quercetin dioxygenase-like cupin family protein
VSEAKRIRVEELQGGENAEAFNGHEHDATVCFFLSHNKPGTGPSLHTHPYEEVFIVQGGEVTFTVGDETVEAKSGDILVVPAGTPHKFTCTSEGHRQVSIHPAPRMETEWLE